MSRTAYWVVKAIVEGQEIYLSKAAVRATGRPWTTKQPRALRFTDKDVLTEAFFRELRNRAVSIEIAEHLNLRIVAIVHKQRQITPRHLDHARHAA